MKKLIVNIIILASIVLALKYTPLGGMLKEFFETKCTVSVKNTINEDVRIYLAASVYGKKGWENKGFYTLKPNETKEIFVSSWSCFYYFAESENYIWTDNIRQVITESGDTLNMIKHKIPDFALDEGNYVFQLK